MTGGYLTPQALRRQQQWLRQHPEAQTAASPQTERPVPEWTTDERRGT